MKIETRSVLAGAYRGKSAKLAATLTHAVYVDPNDDTLPPVPLCRGVDPDNIADPYASQVAATPTCPKCAKLDPRGKSSALHAMLRIA